MTTIIPASIEHVPFISEQLAKEYHQLNQELGHTIYKTDVDLFASIVESRIRTSDSEFKYFMLLGEDLEMRGFISLLQKTRGEVLMIGLKNQNKSDLDALLSFGIQYLKDNGSECIIFEASPQEKDYQELLKTRGAKNFSSKFVL